MKITLSKAQWQMIGEKTGWIKKAQVTDVAEPELSDTEWEKATSVPSNDLAKQYEEGKDKQYFVTTYKVTRNESDPANDKFEIVSSDPVIGLENADKMRDTVSEKYDTDDYLVFVEVPEEKGLFAT